MYPALSSSFDFRRYYQTRIIKQSLSSGRAIFGAKSPLSGISSFFHCSAKILRERENGAGVKSPADISCAEREPRFRVNTFQGTKRGKRVPENAPRRRRTGRLGARLKRALTYRRHEMRRVKDEKSGAWRAVLSLFFSSRRGFSPASAAAAAAAVRGEFAVIKPR